MNPVADFNEYRSRMNEKILNADNVVIKRLFNLDTRAFQDASLNNATKEMIGLACSMVMRCDDCVKYHLEKCFNSDISKNQVMEVMAIANLIGGTIIIPHLRRAVEYWEALESNVSERS